MFCAAEPVGPKEEIFDSGVINIVKTTMVYMNSAGAGAGAVSGNRSGQEHVF